jgi:hypothetical protein
VEKSNKNEKKENQEMASEIKHKPKRNMVKVTYVTFQVYHGVYSGQRFQDYDLLLDNQVDISLIHP